MALNFLDPQHPKSLNQYFRKRRFAFFENLLKRLRSDKPIRILDIGGTQSFWQRMDFTNQEGVEITLFNLDVEPTVSPNFYSVKGDACDLSRFKDKEFDIVFSNSVIEHLYTYENQKKMAEEVRRVGKYYFIQTPNYFFPVEPHWLFPFFQFLPFTLKVFLTTNLSLGHYKKTLNKQRAIERVKEVRLLREKEMRQLFSGGNIYREKILGLTKSLTSHNF